MILKVQTMKAVLLFRSLFSIGRWVQAADGRWYKWSNSILLSYFISFYTSLYRKLLRYNYFFVIRQSSPAVQSRTWSMVWWPMLANNKTNKYFRYTKHNLDILDHVRKGKIQPSVSGGDKIYRNTIHQQLICCSQPSCGIPWHLS